MYTDDVVRAAEAARAAAIAEWAEVGKKAAEKKAKGN